MSGSMSQNGRYRLAVNAFLQAGRGKTMPQCMEIAVRHFTVFQYGFEFLLHIARFRTDVQVRQNMRFYAVGIAGIGALLYGEAALPEPDFGQVGERLVRGRRCSVV